MTRTNRSIANLASSLLLQLASVGFGMVGTPLLLHWLGDERYGAFRSTSDWMGYLNLLELGLGGALMPMLANAVAQGDLKHVRLTLATGIRSYLKVVLLMLLVGVGLGTVLTHLVPIQLALRKELEIGYWIGLLNFLWLPLTPFRLMIDASQRGYLINALFIVQSFSITSASLYLAHLGFGLPGQFLAIVLGGLIFNGLVSWQGIRQYPDVFLRLNPFGRGAVQEIEQKIHQLKIPTLILNFSGQVGLLTDNIVISYFLGPAVVVPFFMTQRLPMLAQAQIQGIGNATWAALADLYARGEIESFNHRLIDLTKFVTLFGLIFLIPISAYNPDFVTLWVGAARFGGIGLNSLAAINGVLLGILSLWGWCFSGTGNVTKIVRLSITGASVNLTISLIATYFLGIIGPLVGTLVAFITVYLWWMPRLLYQVFGTSTSQLLAAFLRPLGLGIPYAIALNLFTHYHTPAGWLGLAVEMGLAALIFLALAWTFLLSSTERKDWGDRLQHIQHTIFKTSRKQPEG
jgi:O-antigen/teichoic acid export membrane protein